MGLAQVVSSDVVQVEEVVELDFTCSDRSVEELRRIRLSVLREQLGKHFALKNVERCTLSDIERLINLTAALRKLKIPVGLMFELFDGAQSWTYQTALRLFEEEQWGALRTFLYVSQGLIEPELPKSPLRRHLEEGELKKEKQKNTFGRFLEGKRVAVIGESKSMEEKRRVLIEAGASKVIEYEGKGKLSHIGDIDVDIIICIVQQMDHKTQDALRNRVGGFAAKRILCMLASTSSFLGCVFEGYQQVMRMGNKQYPHSGQN